MPMGECCTISGVIDLRAALLAGLEGSFAGEACAFQFEEDPMYTQRESEMLARHLQEHGRMPEGNDVLGDVFGDDDEDGR